MTFLKLSVNVYKILLIVSLVLIPARTEAQSLPLNLINLPDGFKISVYAKDIPNARSLDVSPSGTVFVGNRTGEKVYALTDTDKDYSADRIYTLADGLFYPNGVAFREGDLYIAEINRVTKLIDVEKNLANPPEPTVVNDSFPGITHHGRKFIAFGPDTKLYIPIGAPCKASVKFLDLHIALLTVVL